MRRMLLLIAIVLLAACSRGPDQQALENDLRQRLQQAFPGDKLSLVALHRRGSADDAHDAPGEDRLLVYFDAELRVEHDLDFGSWDSPGVASLVSVLGAGPRGLRGIESGGNRQGDRLLAHGSLIYQQRDGAWQAVVPQGFSAPRAPQTSSTVTPREALVQAIGTALNLSHGGTGGAERKVISEELERSLTNIQGRLGRLQNGYPLAGGPESGQYSSFAQAMSLALREHGLNILPLTTEGGLENLRLLQEGEVVLALSQSDMAHLAVSGAGPFAERGLDHNLRALASLYPEPVHVLVRADSDLHDIAALRGKRVSLGTPNSASRATAIAVLSAHNLQPQDLALAADFSLQQALAELRDGRLDALIQVIGSPADSIRAASEDVPLRLLPLADEAIARLQGERPGSYAYQLPAASYPGQDQALSTLAVSSLLLSNQQLTNHEVELLLSQLFASHREWLQYGSVQGGQLSPENAMRGLGVPLHEGAEKTIRQLRSAAQPDGRPAR
ncbi:TAXI family TRAP transporter solute-binding subunit [Aquipseudomonas alcaligenes]|uniref:TAXI family TRAP transporter solute-binding subunit n=1 Tax=Aquipseudomonas alcaligenes TaxID=43263 RepID=UPI0037480BFB